MNIDTIIEYATLHTVTIITFFISFFTIAHMLTSRKKPSYMIAWTVVIIALPYIGVILYLIFNGRKLSKGVSKKRKIKLQNIDEIDKFDIPIEKFLRASHIAGATDKNSFYLCRDSVDTYEQIVKNLQKAKRSIYISTYIFGDDQITMELLRILSKKAKDGVEVKLLIDSLGSLSLELYPKILKSLQDNGGQYCFFMSVIKHPLRNRINFRNHRKMIIIDNHTLISGGINISKDYLSKDENSTVWKDMSFIIKGRATLHYTEIFKYDWESQTKEEIKIINYSKEEQKDDSIIQVVPSGPDVNNDALYESILYALFLAKDKIWILTPYFVPDGALMDALIIAKHRGVDIKLILPKNSDQFLADMSRSGYLRDLQKEGIDIFLYTPKMLHAKAMIIDDELAMVGSSNFDARSFFYNFEVMSYLYSKKDIIEVKNWISLLFDECETRMRKAGKIRIIFENLFKMLSPAL